jgi:predicted ABC-type ATPase
MKPRLIVIAGPNGSGKTSITSQILGHEWAQGCDYINPDNIARDVFGDWNGRETVLKAAQYAEDWRQRCLAEKRDFVFETVLSIPDKVQFIRQAKNAGFFVRLFFIATDTPFINVARIAQRVVEGGHTVPTDKTIARYFRSIANGAEAAKWSDRGYFFDNSVDDAPPTLLFRSVDGVVIKQYPAFATHPWGQQVVAALTGS